jgi:hypothetical protein
MTVEEWKIRLQKLIKKRFISLEKVEDEYHIKFANHATLRLNESHFANEENKDTVPIWVYYFFEQEIENERPEEFWNFFLNKDDRIFLRKYKDQIIELDFHLNQKTSKENFLQKSELHQLAYKWVQENHIDKASNRMDFIFHQI